MIPAHALSGLVTLTVAGYATDVVLTEQQLRRVYLPLLDIFRERSRRGNHRLLIGLAGVPGGGKSTFAAAVGFIAERLWGADSLVVVGMDGWHYSNAELERRLIRDDRGNEVSLRRRKGSPNTFDAVAMADALRSTRDDRSEARLPAYDRRLHEPVASALTVRSEVRALLVEGNYVLENASPWGPVSSLLSPKMFLECDGDVARRHIIARHVRGGLTEAAAVEKFEDNDRANTAVVLATARHADMLIRLEPEPELRIVSRVE